jgi:hypothetical protein
LTKAATWKDLHAGELADALGVAPFLEASCRVQVRLARVVVVDLGGEEFEDPPRLAALGVGVKSGAR